MGRLLLILIVIAGALAGIWFFAPGGKDMLMGVKEKAMGHMPAKADDTADIVVDDAAAATEEVVDEVVDGVEDATAADETGAEEAPAAAEEAPQL